MYGHDTREGYIPRRHVTGYVSTGANAQSAQLIELRPALRAERSRADTAVLPLDNTTVNLNFASTSAAC